MRNRSVPCSLGCGGKVWYQPGKSRPVDKVRCQSCSAKLQPSTKLKACKICQTDFAVPRQGRSRRTCSKACELVARRRYKPGQCSDCPGQTLGPKRCPDCIRKRQQAKDRRKNVKRRGVPAPSRRIGPHELGERDGWRCHLCRKRVDPGLRSPHPMSASADHLIPISDGGDDEPANLALAHRYCNEKRGVGGAVQLALVG